MYVIRDGPIHRQASQFRRGSIPRSMFFCCGNFGVGLIVAGGVILGVGQGRKKNDDYTLILFGSIVLGFGFIVTVLAIFLSVSWSALNTTETESTNTPRRVSRSASVLTRETPVIDDF